MDEHMSPDLSPELVDMVEQFCNAIKRSMGRYDLVERMDAILLQFRQDFEKEYDLKPKGAKK